MKQIARLTLFTPARSGLLRFRGHFGHELGRGLRAQQLLLRELGSACCSPRFLLPLLVFSALVKQWHVCNQTCLETLSTCARFFMDSTYRRMRLEDEHIASAGAHVSTFARVASISERIACSF
jgi:hypothetical protein